MFIINFIFKYINQVYVFIRESIYNIFILVFDTLGKPLGYPDTNLGMTTAYAPNNSKYYDMLYRNKLPFRKVWPDVTIDPWKIPFGEFPKLNPIKKEYFISDKEGFYNFYYEEYRNSFCLPDWLSEIIQIQFQIGVNTSELYSLVNLVFGFLTCYNMIFSFRVLFYWFLAINPYTLPWRLFISAVDWLDDSFSGLVPSTLGLNLSSLILMLFIGNIADSLNNLVFTMPYLPSEGQRAKMVLEDERTAEVVVYHYLPKLWVKYPIPNEIREFWSKKRPDILKFYSTKYKALGIDWSPNTPDNIREAHYDYKGLVTNIIHDLKIDIWFQNLWNNITSFFQSI